jgi:pyridinium-3,5-bisthiocarboxylic acid mononucleotide nickel chelatase
MKLGYLNCFSGISGDMFLGALLSAGLSEDHLRAALAQAGVKPGELEITSVSRKGLQATALTVKPAEDRHHLHVEDIRRIIADNDLPDPVKQNALTALEKIVRAESKIHGMPMDHVHLHEISGLDTIVDLLGVSYGIHKLGIDKLICSPLTIGSGTIKIAHGTFPVPAPATLEILQNIPTRQSGLTGEHVTPTGAALVSTFADDFGDQPLMTIQATGYGAGTKQEGDVPNVARLVLGEQTIPSGNDHESLVMVETSIDDQSAEQIAFAMEKLENHPGVLETVIIPVIMKKGRPGFLLRILCKPKELTATEKILFAETTTLGVRHFPMKRRILDRSEIKVKTEYGVIRVKCAGKTRSPEYEDCRRSADEYHVPLRTVYHAARQAADAILDA